MANYGAKLTKATTDTTVGVGAINTAPASPRRLKIYDILFGSSAAGDTQFVFDVQRATTLPTGAAVVPDPLDPADPATTAVAAENLTVNGTLTANAIVLSVPMNQRSTVRWACREGKEIIIPATADNGVQFQTPVASLTPAAVVHAFFEQM